MRLIGLAVFLAFNINLAPLTAEAQQAGKVYRIGALSDGPNPASAPLAHAMRELGWVAGQNFMIEQRNARRETSLLRGENPARAGEAVGDSAACVRRADVGSSRDSRP
jgi:hypothetical protein